MRSNGSAGAQIEQSPSHELDQLLKDVPGVQLFRRSDARSGHPTSQGVTLRALGGNASSRALLVLDGVPQSDPFGGWVNWPAYDPADLAGIRVVRGGGSVANGPGALAGTIEMTSRADAGVSGEIDGGSRESLEARARIGAASPAAASLSLSGQRRAQRRLRPDHRRDPRARPTSARPIANGAAAGAGSRRSAATTELQASLAAFHDWRTRGTDFTANRTNGADASLRLVGRGRWQWSALGYWQWRNLMSSFANVSPGRIVATRVSLQDSVPSHGLGGSFELRPPMPDGLELRLGARRAPDRRRVARAVHLCRRRADAAPARGRRELDQRRLRRGDRRASRGITLTGGGRLDHWRIERRPSVRADDRHRRGAARRPFPVARRLAADRARRACWRRSAAASACARRPISAGGCRR